MELLLGLSLGLIGIVSGVYVSGLIHDHRIADLSATQYVAMHQMRDKTFRNVMPALGITTFGLALISTVVGFSSGTPRLLGAATLMLLLIDIAVAVSRQLPLNQKIQTWSEATIPDDWELMSNQWAFHHTVRSMLGLAAFACFLTAVLLTIGR
ncbi:MAG: DUF1772 domain-containing protein [Methylocystis silviterrae]